MNYEKCCYILIHFLISNINIDFNHKAYHIYMTVILKKIVHIIVVSISHCNTRVRCISRDRFIVFTRTSVAFFPTIQGGIIQT